MLQHQPGGNNITIYHKTRQHGNNICQNKILSGKKKQNKGQHGNNICHKQNQVAQNHWQEHLPKQNQEYKSP